MGICCCKKKHEEIVVHPNHVNEPPLANSLLFEQLQIINHQNMPSALDTAFPTITPLVVTKLFDTIDAATIDRLVLETLNIIATLVDK